jgi:K+-sensing histidine kinase KdpD
MGLFTRSKLSERQERAVQKTLDLLRAQRRNRFRILACIDGSEDSFATVRMAAKLAPTEDCDIIVLYVRPMPHRPGAVVGRPPAQGCASEHA